MKLGIIGGSGVYDAGNIGNLKEISVETPFGAPSDKFTTGTISGLDFVFLPRHGKGHRILPGELNHRANIFAMKKLGVTHIISISAVGSLQAKYRPRDIVVVDQYFDRTKKGLEHTFFGNGIAAHISMAHPVCPELKELAFKAASVSVKEIHGSKKNAPEVHKGGTYLNMEGPAFSTKAESEVYRSWGMDVIGMTNLGEAKLSREAEICYCTLAMVTDYDCWHPDHDHVTVDMIIQNLIANSSIAKMIILKIPTLRNMLKGKCACGSALSMAIITNKDTIPEKLKRDLKPIIGKYIK
ncbi:MAG TPA: S-methyl-5'-thioadenosine phosphorylase [Lentisphaeria bacterium]|nr:MAG: methylthioadenosine phosphorylase [Lentisphaerae bacterium GWF2_49_21]HBC88217.1 S-methyl-5'-thioadenosine phosphorylase [Lentisphaeria bacterium]